MAAGTLERWEKKGSKEVHFSLMAWPL